MRQITQSAQASVTRLWWAPLAAMVTLAACMVTNYNLRGSELAPQLKGIAAVETIEGDNRLITLRLEALPKPEQVAGDGKVYILWVLGDEDRPVKAARLEYDPRRSLGRARATTPLSRFEFFVSAEPDPDVPYPHDAVVLRQRVP